MIIYINHFTVTFKFYFPKYTRQGNQSIDQSINLYIYGVP